MKNFSKKYFFERRDVQKAVSHNRLGKTVGESEVDRAGCPSGLDVLQVRRAAETREPEPGVPDGGFQEGGRTCSSKRRSGSELAGREVRRIGRGVRRNGTGARCVGATAADARLHRYK